jgi:hypothetical protein
MARHVIISRKKQKTAKFLIKQGYTELEASVEDLDSKTYLLLNTKMKTFYFLDKESLQHAISLIENAFNKKAKILTLKDIKKWED